MDSHGIFRNRGHAPCVVRPPLLAIFTFASILLFLTPGKGNAGAMEIVVFRMIQAIGGEETPLWAGIYMTPMLLGFFLWVRCPAGCPTATAHEDSPRWALWSSWRTPPPCAFAG